MPHLTAGATRGRVGASPSPPCWGQVTPRQPLCEQDWGGPRVPPRPQGASWEQADVGPAPGSPSPKRLSHGSHGGELGSPAAPGAPQTHAGGDSGWVHGQNRTHRHFPAVLGPSWEGTPGSPDSLAVWPPGWGQSRLCLRTAWGGSRAGARSPSGTWSRASGERLPPSQSRRAPGHLRPRCAPRAPARGGERPPEQVGGPVSGAAAAPRQ